MNPSGNDGAAELRWFGVISVEGADARAFLHAQLSNDVQGQPPDRARYAGWCSAKGRLLATCLVIPRADGFLLHTARDVAPAVARRLSMFVLRSKVRVADASERWSQFGLWGDATERLVALGITPQGTELAVTVSEDRLLVAIGAGRYLLLGPGSLGSSLKAEAPEDDWMLAEIRAGRPWIGQATQDQFVPQMVNLDLVGGVDFRKGCYPGQEIVARTQYLGQLKRRMLRARSAAVARPGGDLYADDPAAQAVGTVVNAAPLPGGGSELLAVIQSRALVQEGSVIRIARDGPPIEVLPLPYAT